MSDAEEYNKKWREANKEHIREYAKQWKAKNREKALAYGRKYWEKHREERVEYKRKNYAENREYYLAQGKKWRQANKKARSISQRKQYQNNRVVAYARRWAFDNKEKILSVLGTSCFDCGSVDNIHIHHKNYVGKDGNYTKDFTDLEIVCSKCHGLRHRVHFYQAVKT